MSMTTLRLTQFTVQKLQCIGSRGRAAPYQITTYEGAEVGAFGEILPLEVEASNAAVFKKSRPNAFIPLLKLLQHAAN